MYSCDAVTIGPHEIARINTGIGLDLSNTTDIYAQVLNRSSIVFDLGIQIGAGCVDKGHKGGFVCVCCVY